MMKRRVLSVLLAATAGLLLGLLWRASRSHAPSYHEANDGSVSLLSSRTDRFANVTTLSQDDLTESERLRILADFEAPDTTADCWEILERLNSWSTVDRAVLSILVPPLIDQLVADDPQLAFRRLLQSSSWNLREAYLGTLMQSWTRADPQAALRQLERMEDTGTLQKRLAGAVADVLTGSDPETSVRLISDFQLAHSDEEFLSTATYRERFKDAFSALAARKPLLAATEAQRLTDRYQRKVALVASLETWGGVGSEEALSFLQNKVALQEFHHWSDLWAALARGMARQDPNNALELISNHAPAILQPFALADLTKTWAQSDPQEAAEFALTQPDLGPPMLETIGKAWAKQDSEAALDWAHSLPDALRPLAMKGLAVALRTEDHAKAFEAYAESGDPNIGHGLIRFSASRDWRGTVDTLSQWEDPRLRGHAAINLFEYAYEASLPMGDDSSMLLDWVAEAADDVRAPHFHRMARGLGEQDLAYLKTEHPTLYRNSLPYLSQAYALSDPAIAAALTRDIQESGARKMYLVDVIQQWAARAPEEAALWLQSQPPDDAREAGFTALRDIWSRFDPSVGEGWENDLPAPIVR